MMDLKKFPPDWFDLKKYDEKTAMMGASEWSHALHLRSYLWSISKGQIEEAEPGFFLDILSKLVSLNLYKYNRDHIPAEFRKSVHSVNLEQMTAYWLTCLDHKCIAPFKENIIFEHGDNMNDEQLKLLQSYKETPLDLLWSRTGEDFIDHAGAAVLVSVDLAATDEQLVKDFKSWLSFHKTRLGITTPRNKIISSEEFKDWHNKKILPYIDLMLYAYIGKHTPTHLEIGKLLFPDEFEISLPDKIRRTLKPLAEQLTSETFNNILASQAASENA